MRVRSWMIWYAVALHMIWGVMLLRDERAGWVTAIHTAGKWIPGGATTEGAMMIVVAVLAAVSLVCLHTRPVLGLCLLLPQQAILVFSMFGAVEAIATSAFADGVVRPRAFIAADQCPAILACVLHTLAILGIHAPSLCPWAVEGDG